MRNEIELSDEAIEAIFDEHFGVGIVVGELTFTRDTIQNFVDGLQNFIEWEKPWLAEFEGRPTLEVRRIKVAKGKPKQDIQVVDFGTVRALYQSMS
jgi:hypothetical protein